MGSDPEDHSDGEILSDEKIHSYYDRESRTCGIFIISLCVMCVCMLPFMIWSAVATTRVEYGECLIRDYREVYTVREPFEFGNPMLELVVSYTGQLDKKGVLVFENAGNISNTRQYYAPGKTLLCTVCNLCISKIRRVSATYYTEGLISGADWGRGTLTHAFNNESAHRITAITTGALIGVLCYLCLLLAAYRYNIPRHRDRSLDYHGRKREERMEKASSTGGVYHAPVEIDWSMTDKLIGDTIHSQ